MAEDGMTTVRIEPKVTAGLRRIETIKRTTEVKLTPLQVYDALADALGCLPVKDENGNLPDFMTISIELEPSEVAQVEEDDRLDVDVKATQMRQMFTVSWMTETCDSTEREIGEPDEVTKLLARLDSDSKGVRLTAEETASARRLLERLR